MLNTFSFSGGFSLYAARGGARSVTDLDISAHALDAARRNFALNSAVESVSPLRTRVGQGRCFRLAGQNFPGPAYDLVSPRPALDGPARVGALHCHSCV